MKINRKHIDSIYKQYGHINIEVLVSDLDLSPGQATKLLLHVAQLGWYLPVVEAFFAPPSEDGAPVRWRAVTSKVREAKAEKVLAFIIKAKAATVRDVRAGLDMGDTPTRDALRELALNDRVYHREAKGGGMYNNHPVIYGVDEVSVKAREARLIEEYEAKRKAPRKKKGKSAVTPEDDMNHSTPEDAHSGQRRHLLRQFEQGEISQVFYEESLRWLDNNP